MAEAGVLREEDRVELLEGWIVPKMIRNPKHDAVVGLAHAALAARLPEGWFVRIQSAITTKDSEPEPDVAIIRGPIRRYLGHHPGSADVALVVEVADTSLVRDRQKARLYAAAGIPAYWLVNLAGLRIEIYAAPVEAVGRSEYTVHRTLGSNDTIPLVIEGNTIATIPAAELLP